MQKFGLEALIYSAFIAEVRFSFVLLGLFSCMFRLISMAWRWPYFQLSNRSNVDVDSTD